MKTYKTLVVYDDEGFLITTKQGQPIRLPVGVPYIYEEIPQGKKLISSKVEGETLPVVDVSVTPHQLILEDIPPTEIENIKTDMNSAIMELTMLISMGGM